LYDVSRATALALPLLAVALVVGYVVAPIGNSVLTTGRPSTGIGIRFPRLGPIVAAVVAGVFAVSVVLPFGILTAEAGSVPAIKTALVRSGAVIGESLLLAGIAATLASAAALALGYARARWRHPAGRSADAALIALFAVPGTITGIALIELWNRPGWLGSLYGTPTMLVIAYLARFIPVATVILSSAVRRVPRSSEEAAALSGAGWVRTMWRIVVPQLVLSLVVAWVVVFVLAFGEVGASVLVVPPGHAPYPVHVFTLIANAPTEQVAALALVQAAVVVCPFLLATAYVSWARTRHA
jgi:iron(III) transport system permease protein